MKEGWTYKKLGDCFISINNGANIKQVKGAKGIPVTRIETLSNDKFNRERMGYADILDASPYSSYILNDGDILMSHINSMKYLGRAVQYSKKEDEIIIHGMNLLRLVPAKDVLSSFLIYQFYTAFFRNQIVSISHQSVNQASFNTTNLKSLRLKVPPLSEQKRIVSRLDSAFAHIDELKANAEKQLSEARALFQKALAKAIEPKEGWEEKKLGELSIDITDGDHQPPPKSPVGVPFITISNIVKDSNKIDFKDTFHVPQEYYNALKDNRKPQKGDVLYTVTGSFGIPVLINFEEEFCFQRHIALIRPKQDILYSEFLYYWILSDYAVSQADDVATGAAQRTVSLKSLRNFSIVIPSLSEQRRIVARLDSLSENVRKYEEIQKKVIAECDNLKQAMLRQVFE